MSKPDTRTTAADALSPEAYLRSLNTTYVERHVAKEEAFWSSMMGLGDAKADRKALEARELELRELLQDPERLKETRRQREIAEQRHAEEDVKVALTGWVRTFESHALESAQARAVAAEALALEGELGQERAALQLTVERDGERQPVSSVELAVLISGNPDESVRRSAWEGLRAVEPHVLDRGYLDVVRKRNAYARLAGYSDYYEYKAHCEGLSKAAIFGLLDDLERRTRDAAIRSLDALRAKHGPNATAPYNLPYFATGDVTEEMDPYFPFEESLGRWMRSFAALGIDYRGADLVLDLVDRKGKYENGFMHGPEPAWRNGGQLERARIHFTANAIVGLKGSGERATKVLFHEGGHAAHFANIDMPAPCFAQEFAPTSPSFAETQSMFLDSLLTDADWLYRYATTKDGGRIPVELVLKGIDKTQPFAALQVRGMLAICYAERAIYELPETELSKGRVMELVREVERAMLPGCEGSWRPVLSVPHLLAEEASAYYHAYVLALMAVHQTRNHFLSRDGHLVDNPAIGPELKEAYWRPGNSRTFIDMVQALTGQQVGAEALASRVNQTGEERRGAAANAIRRLSEVPPYEGGFDLNANIRVMHGKELIAEAKAGDEASYQKAVKDFAAWIEKQDKRKA